MLEEAKPSAGGLQPQEPALLAEAEAKFQEGIAAIKGDDIEQAVQLFSEVLAVRVKHYGELALECASVYYRYGSALLYQAQDSADYLGGPARTPADDGDKENSGSPHKGSGSGAPEAGSDLDADEEEAKAGEGPAPGVGGGEEEGAAVEGDLQLAWENLEAARAIWAKHADAHHPELDSTHVLLGDINMENEAFDAALADYDSALEHQLAGGYPADDRRSAELHFKRCCALQFMDRLEEALAAVRQAVEVLRLRQANLAAVGEGQDEAMATEAAAEAGVVGGVLVEILDKAEELEGLVQEAQATRSMMRGAMEQLGAAMAAAQQGGGDGGPEAAAGGATQQQQQQQQGGGQVPSTVASPVRDLGVVGRGKKRINLAPVGPPAAAAPQTGGSGSAAAAAPKKVRLLEDLMGSGGGGETGTGFGAATAPAPASTEGAAPPLPAFLQAYSKPAPDGQ